MDQFIAEFGLSGVILYLVVKELLAYRNRRNNNKGGNPVNSMLEFRESVLQRLTKLETTVKENVYEINKLREKYNSRRKP